MQLEIAQKIVAAALSCARSNKFKPLAIVVLDARGAQHQPHFIAAVTHAVGGSLIPVPGGVLINDRTGVLLGAIGISGDTSDNDEIAALAGIEAAGCKGDPGA